MRCSYAIKKLALRAKRFNNYSHASELLLNIRCNSAHENGTDPENIKVQPAGGQPCPHEPSD